MGFEEAFQAADIAVRSIRVEGLRDIDRVVLEGSWNRKTYQKIASEAGYTEGYLSRDIGPALWSLLSGALGMQVKKTNFRTAIERWAKQHPEASKVTTAVLDASLEANPAPLTVDKDTPSINVDAFRGRQDEIQDLGDWILQHQGRLLCLFGMPGIGKTWLAIKLAEELENTFQRIIYRDLSDRPTPLDLILDLLASLQVAPPEPTSLMSSLETLAQALVQMKCLIILDGNESFCRHSAFAGTYEPPFEDYAQVLETFATYDHQSCVFWVGRELPRSSAHVAGSSSRLYQVTGLDHTELPKLTFWPADVSATEADWEHLHTHYGGVLSLMQGIVPRLASFGNHLEACLSALRQDQQLTQDYLQEWLSPLSETEWSILTWLMLSRRPLSLTQLSSRLGISMPLAAIESLCERGVCRSLVNGGPHWDLALPDLLSRYLSDRFITTFQSANAMQRLDLLERYLLTEADAPETVRQWQKKTILPAIADILAEDLSQLSDKKAFLQQALQLSRQQHSIAIPNRYSAGNLINLAHYWQVALVDLDCQRLTLQGADLQSDWFQGVSFAGSDLSQTLLAKPLGESPVIAISPAQEQVAVGDQDGRLLLWNLNDGRLQRAIFDVPDAIEVITFSDDGHILAEGREDGQVRLWDLRSEYGPELFATTSAAGRSLDGTGNNTENDAAIAADTSFDRAFSLANSPQAIANAPLKALAFSPNMEFLAGGDQSGYLHIWRVASGEHIYRLAAHSAAITAVTFSPCSRWVATCGQDCTAVEWDLAAGEAKTRFQGRMTNWLGAVAYLPMEESDLKPVVLGRDDGQIVIWAMQSDRPLRVMAEPGDMAMAVALSPNGRYLAVSDVSNTLSVWNIATRQKLYDSSASKAPIASLVFSANNRELLTGCDYAVQLWQVNSGHCLRSWRSDRHPAIDLTLVSYPLQLLSSHDDRTLRCWRPADDFQDRWLPHERLQLPSESPISAVATQTVGCYWVVGTEAGLAHVWHREHQRWLAIAIHLPSSITELAMSPDETYLAIGDTTGTVALWNLAEGRFCWQKQAAHEDKIAALTFSPDSQRIFSGSRDRTIQGWDQEGNCTLTITEHRRRVHTLCVSADSQTLYTGSYDGTVRCWDLATLQSLCEWQQGAKLIHCVTRDAGNRPVVIVSDTQSLEVWDLEANACRFKLPPQDETIWHVSVSPDGRWLVTAEQDGEISVWSLASGELQGQLRVDRPYEGMQIGGCTGLTDSERLMLHSLGATDY